MKILATNMRLFVSLMYEVNKMRHEVNKQYLYHLC